MDIYLRLAGVMGVAGLGVALGLELCPDDSDSAGRFLLRVEMTSVVKS